MAINREKDHKGRKRIVVSKYWPDASRFRRYFPNMTVAKKAMARIEESIAMGTWKELREELSSAPTKQMTVEEFSTILAVSDSMGRSISVSGNSSTLSTSLRNLTTRSLAGASQPLHTRQKSRMLAT